MLLSYKPQIFRLVFVIYRLCLKVGIKLTDHKFRKGVEQSNIFIHNSLALLILFPHPLRLPKAVFQNNSIQHQQCTFPSGWNLKRLNSLHFSLALAVTPCARDYTSNIFPSNFQNKLRVILEYLHTEWFEKVCVN